MWRNTYNETDMQKRIFTSVIMILQTYLVCSFCVSEYLNLDIEKVSIHVASVSVLHLVQMTVFAEFADKW